MLSDWEKRSLASIEDELRRDRGLAALLEGPVRVGGLRAISGRPFYPLGYLTCAVVFMVATLGVGAGTLIWALLGGLGLWGYVEWRARPAAVPSRR